MIEEKNLFKQKPACALPEYTCMSTSLQHTLAGCLPTSQMLSVSAPMPGSAICGMNHDIDMVHADQALPPSFIPHTPSWKVGQACGAKGLPQNPWRHFQNISPSAGLYPVENKSGFINANTAKTAGDAVSGSLLKGFHIFDKSGSQTRLIYSSAYPHAPDATPVAATTKLASFCDFHDRQAFRATLFSPLQPILPGKVNENEISIEEDEMQEDTEEINALLYSSEEDSDSYDEDDEVMSTGHSPITFKRSYDKLEHGDEMTEEVGSSDWRKKKRQKQLKGADMEASLSDTACSLNLGGTRQCDIDVQSCHTYGQLHGEETGCIPDKNPSKKDNVRTMLKILGGVVPGAKGKEPLFVLDKAIDYLKTLKLEATSLGVN